MISIPPFSTLAKTSLPSEPGTWLFTVKPSLSVQNLMQGSTASTMSTGVSCFRVAGVSAELSFASAIKTSFDPHHNKKKAGLRGRPFFNRLSTPSGDGSVATLVGVEAGTKDSANYAEYSEVHSWLNGDVAVCRIRGLENHRAVLAGIGLDGRFFTQTRSDDVVVARILARITHPVEAVVDAAADHAGALHLQEENFVRRDEASVDGDEAVTMLRKQRRLACVNSSIERHGLRAHCRAEAEEIHATRSGRISLDITFFLQRLEQIRDSLRRLDLELLADVTNARLVGILGGEVEKIVVHRALELC